MKKNIKIGIFSISIFYSIVVITLMILNLLSIKTEVYLSVDGDNENIIKQYRDELSKLTQNDCTKSISEIVDYYEITSYDGFVDLKQIYEPTSIITFYGKTKDVCNITNELQDKYNFVMKTIGSTQQSFRIYHKTLFQYELSIKDIKSRFVAVGDINDIEYIVSNMEYQVRKNIEQELIEDLIEIAKNKEEVVIYEE